MIPLGELETFRASLQNLNPEVELGADESLRGH